MHGSHRRRSTRSHIRPRHASSTPHTEAVTPERRYRDNESASAVENSVGSNEAAQILGLGRLASFGTKMENPRIANEVGIT
jgi:hypothetical protein